MLLTEQMFIFFFFRENLAGDCFQGCLVVTCTLCGFISLVWLREQILHGGGPDWLEQLGNNNNGNNPNRVSQKVFSLIQLLTENFYLQSKLFMIQP